MRDSPIATAAVRSEAGRIAPGLLVVLAFAAIYFIWGTTFLAIRIGVETLPPFLMMAIRCLVGGVILVLLARPRASALWQPRAWRDAFFIGGLFFVGCQGVLAEVQQRVPSGAAALFTATVPLWVPLLAWAAGVSGRPSRRTMLGLGAGFAGVALLIRVAGDPLTGHFTTVDVILLLVCPLSWALGTVASRFVATATSRTLTAGMQLFAGGLLLAIVAALRGEVAAFDPAAVSLGSIASLGYLIVLGTVIAFNAYVWLLGTVAPSRVATYAFVNPVVAVLVGWALAGEAVTASMLAAMAIIVAAVAVTVTART
ncbi:MAG: EamA family transporter [Proteobacteria bacterium]|nr:EamA family transporter [Pseudomonadota bacterium]